jgi:hypothetical protein
MGQGTWSLYFFCPINQKQNGISTDSTQHLSPNRLLTSPPFFLNWLHKGLRIPVVTDHKKVVSLGFVLYSKF